MAKLLITLVAVLPALALLLLPQLVRFVGRLLGWYFRQSTRHRRSVLLSDQRTDATKGKRVSRGGEDDDWEKVEGAPSGTGVTAAAAKDVDMADREWRGIVGFFHPFCNAGGGGERVLWAAIRATQDRWRSATCVVYTGDHDADKDAILKRVEDRFNIHLHPPTVHFLYLTTRHYVLASTWPRFTLIGQSLGSLVLAADAFGLLVPDIFIDTMGYAFTLAFCHWLFPDVPTGAYVHYPTISTDMLASLSAGGQGLNAGTGEGFKGSVKRKYWHAFAWLYSWVGSNIDVVITNGSWTQNHIKQLWGPRRAKAGKQGGDNDIAVVFPPVAVEEVAEAVEVSEESEKKRRPYILYIAQFRPEKNHTLIMEAFDRFWHAVKEDPSWKGKEPPKLILVGSVRDSDDATRVYKLRLLAHELKIKEAVEFVCDATWPQILEWLRRASVGVNGMWNEHFGIGVVEYQAAGLIGVVHNTAGPKMDIVVEMDGKPTGFHAETAEEFAAGFQKALSLPPDEALAMRRRARQSAMRFTEAAFTEKWLRQMDKLVRLSRARGARTA